VGWDDAVAYFTLLGERSDRVNTRQIGETTDGRPFLLLEISSSGTMENLDRYRAFQQRLYFQDHRPGEDPSTLHSEGERAELFRDHKAVLLFTCSIHASEVGAAQMSLELAYRLATSDDPEILKILDNTILLLVPSLNPDGQAMVVDWYDEYVGTEFEGGGMPWLYQRYVGHDNNRDMYMYTHNRRPASSARSSGRSGSLRSGWTSTRWAPAAPASSSCPPPTPSTPMSTLSSTG